MSEQDRMGYIGAAALAAGLIGLMLPWVEVVSVFGRIGVNGLDTDDGKLAGAAGLVALLLAVFKSHLGACIVGAIAAAITAWDWWSIRSKLDDASSEYAQAVIGNGLYLSAAGFGVGAIFSLIATQTRNGPPPA